MPLLIPEHVEKLKEAVLKRQELVSERNQIRARINSGVDFFFQQLERPNGKELAQGAKLMSDYLKKLKDIDDAIFELDTVTICRFEEELLDTIIKVRTKDTQNEAGDNVNSNVFYCVPRCYAKDDMITVDADDLFFLKIIKSAFSVQNIELIAKEDGGQDA